MRQNVNSTIGMVFIKHDVSSFSHSHVNFTWPSHVHWANRTSWYNSMTSQRTTEDTEACAHIHDVPTHIIHNSTHFYKHLAVNTHRLSRSLSHTHSYTPTTKYAHSKSAWINKRWSCASQPNLWGGDSLPHRQGSAGASERDTAGFQETNLFVYCLGVLSVVTVHCRQPILGMFF